MPATPWTYLPSTPGGPLAIDRAFYDRLARETDRRTPVERFVVPIRTGRAWPVRSGQLCRIVTIEGPQVADFNCWHLANPRERFWAARTKQLVFIVTPGTNLATSAIGAGLLLLADDAGYLLATNRHVAEQLFIEALADFARSDELTFFARERRDIDGKDHRDRRLVNGDAR